MTKIDKKQQILKAAVTLFSRAHDARKVSVEEIAAEARVSPTTIYNLFGTREALVVDSARVLLREILKMSADVLHSDLSFPEKLRAVVGGKTDLVGQYSREVLVKLLGGHKSAPIYGRELYESEIKPLWRDFIESGKREGYIDPAVDDDALLLYFDIIRAGMATRPELTADVEKHMTLIEKLTDFMFHGFLKKEVDLFPIEEKVKT